MKRIYTILVAVLISASVFAQSPDKMSYQLVVRDASSNLITNTQVGLQIRILQGSATGTEVYIETQTPTTNANGLLSVEIGGQTGFDTIIWANGPYFIETSIDPTGETAYTITGTSQLLSVPYALYAKNTASWSVNNDSIYTLKKVGIGTTNITTDNNPELYIKDTQSSVRIKLEGETDTHGSNCAIAFYGIDESAFATIAGVKTSNGVGDIVFKTDNGVNHSEKLRITSDGIITVKDVIQLTPRSSAPTNPVEGQMYMDSTTHKLMVYDGTTWQACW